MDCKFSVGDKKLALPPSWHCNWFLNYNQEWSLSTESRINPQNNYKKNKTTTNRSKYPKDVYSKLISSTKCFKLFLDVLFLLILISHYLDEINI